ncbi:hypothetical protein [Chryseobacterium sp.]|uniref:hypothetical protein n=1 Tax=Chryseobacterium sp. TaxID=1871047 RepID=UPI002898ED8B|nr:hypothetical protein [Chryseobacterium sp.]
MKNSFLLTLSLSVFVAVVSCSNSVAYKSELKPNSEVNQQSDKIEFSEVKRFNRNVVIPETSVITTFKQTIELYRKLADKTFGRSEPIPTLGDSEYFLVLKPKLKKITYGDIEVENIENKNSSLTVSYKEVESNEYGTEKLTNPILIIKIKGKVPDNIKLKSIN